MEIDNSHIHGTASSQFSYKSPQEWSKQFPTCGGRRQSPINIDSRNSQIKEYPPIRFNGYGKAPRSMNVTNDGHTVEITTTWANQEVPTISGGPLNGPYEFEEVHFHWGNNNHVGSEHTINGRQFSLEMHVVHFRKSYGTFTEALKHGDGIAVLGYIFFGTSNSDNNEGIRRLLRSTAPQQAFGPGESELISPFPLTFFNLDFTRKGYYTYLGSLTTPPCTESVIWLVPKSIRNIDSRELAAFRSFPLDNEDDHDYRPVRPLNGRSVFSVRGIK
ncbi:hypothetical protein QAD02_006436 [Eretmocerus hayati]|uniref:Uncharacterized protein n=1 Tax=Eretmocerus hayati TaxID=131215 RepID=A0ACC2N381_9HYME|nr:hypothetical protein QAD02_006436 [Eretmocerus hayati]